MSRLDVDELLRADGVRPPRQDRSRATFERLLNAAQELLAAKGLDGTSMAGVCERAGSSIGALYARIPNKAALVRAVQLRALDRQLTAFEELVAHGPESAASLAEIIDELTMHVTAVLPREVGGLVRAIMIQGTRDPVMRQRVSFVWDEVTRLLADVLRRRADEHRHPQPDLAAEMIVRTLNGLLLQVVVFERPSDERLPAELRTLFFRYLGMAEGRGG